MKLNKTLFKKLIVMLTGSAIPENKFDMTTMNGKRKGGIRGKCGCVLYHAHRTGILKRVKDRDGDVEYYHPELGIPSEHYDNLFGQSEGDRKEFYGTDQPTKGKVADAFKLYLRGLIKAW